MTMQVIFDKVNKIYYAGQYLTGFVRLRGVEGRQHSSITGRIHGGIKYGRKSKDPNAKDKGFSFMDVLDLPVTIAEEGILFVFLLKSNRKDGSNDFPFKLELPKSENIVESYKGIHIAANYHLEVSADEMRHSELFYIQHPVY